MKILSVNESDEEKVLSDQELKRLCIKYAKNNFQGYDYLNEGTGKKIRVSSDGIGKFGSMTKSREQSISLKKLDEIIINSQKTGNLSDSKGRHTVDGFTYYEQRIDINDIKYIVKMATKETHGDESKYYYHFLEDLQNDKKK